MQYNLRRKLFIKGFLEYCMEEVVDKTKAYEDTLDLDEIIGVKVLSEKGFRVGRVSQLRINAEEKSIEGILVKRGIFKGYLFIGRTYFETLSSEAIILNIEPSVLLRGKKVVAYDGEVIGKIKDIIRVAKTNSIKNIVVHSFLRGTFNIPFGEIKGLGRSVILKNTYNAPKKSIWRRAS